MFKKHFSRFYGTVLCFVIQKRSFSQFVSTHIIVSLLKQILFALNIFNYEKRTITVTLNLKSVYVTKYKNKFTQNKTGLNEPQQN